MVDTRDIGKSGAACLAAHGEGHHGKYYEMNGPEMLDGEFMAKVLAKVFGKSKRNYIYFKSLKFKINHQKGKSIKYNELPRDKLRSVMPEGFLIIFFLAFLKVFLKSLYLRLAFIVFGLAGCTYCQS